MNYREKILNYFREHKKLPPVDCSKQEIIEGKLGNHPWGESTTIYPSKELLKEIHLKIIDKLHDELNAAELYHLCFVVDDDSKAGHWVAQTNNYASVITIPHNKL
jgi:hypothetical protein